MPVDHLLARLEVDTKVVGQRLVELLFNSYMPEDKSVQVQLSRAIHLIRANRDAARHFYLHVYRHLTVVSAS